MTRRKKAKSHAAATNTTDAASGKKESSAAERRRRRRPQRRGKASGEDGHAATGGGGADGGGSAHGGSAHGGVGQGGGEGGATEQPLGDMLGQILLVISLSGAGLRGLLMLRSVAVMKLGSGPADGLADGLPPVMSIGLQGAAEYSNPEYSAVDSGQPSMEASPILAASSPRS